MDIHHGVNNFMHKVSKLMLHLLKQEQIICLVHYFDFLQLHSKEGITMIAVDLFEHNCLLNTLRKEKENQLQKMTSEGEDIKGYFQSLQN